MDRYTNDDTKFKNCKKCKNLLICGVVCAVCILLATVIAIIIVIVANTGASNLSTIEKVKLLGNQFVSLFVSDEQRLEKLCFSEIVTIDGKDQSTVYGNSLDFLRDDLYTSYGTSIYVVEGWMELYRRESSTEIRYHVDSNAKHVEQIDVIVFGVDEYHTLTSSRKLTLCTDADYSRMCMKSEGIDLFGSSSVSDGNKEDKQNRFTTATFYNVTETSIKSHFVGMKLEISFDIGTGKLPPYSKFKLTRC